MKNLYSLFFLFVFALTFSAKAQEPTMTEKLTDVNEKVNGILERLATDEADLSKLTKIKVSGYIQTQYQSFEDKRIQPNNYFSIRRARVKFTYEAADGIKFVLQPDFSPGSLSLKDAYATLNDKWTKTMTLWIGKFNRPNYEVEYSSSQREVMERSLLIRTLYPGERAIGAKLEFNPLSVPFHLQLAMFNGNDGLTIKDIAGANANATDNKDYDNYKDLMVRATYNFKLGSFGGLDLGAHGYFGKLRAAATQTLHSDYKTVDQVAIGDGLKRNWVGGEFQLFADVLGGLSLKGEYIAGKNATVGFMNSTTVAGASNYINNFSGYYLYLIKNLGKRNQIAARVDYYDPNTDIKGKDVKVIGYTSPTPTVFKSVMSSKADLATTTWSLCFHHYFDDNIRVSFNYDIVNNEKVGTTGLVTENYTKANGTVVANGIDYGKHVNQNVFTLRIQAKF